ncbi:MAG TPA: hypothetical protein VFC78_18780 [Tepidisphaeraceae bacterium]|nr:hypothetical protein [Tepidisphaeraceae bacterium]
MLDGSEPIDPNEIVYRRVPAGTIYKPNREPPLSQKAFSPRDVDKDGVSIMRGSYVSGPEEAAAEGLAGMQFHVIAFRAGDLIAEGMMLKPDPIPGCPGHALVANINASNRDLPAIQALLDRSRRLNFSAHGPFPGRTFPPNLPTHSPATPKP